MVPEGAKLGSVFRRLLRPSMPRPKVPDHPARLSLISRHLAPVYPINTPFTVERLPDTIDPPLLPKTQARSVSIPPKMAQPPHPTLLIPGPIEFDDAVLQSMSHFRYVHACCTCSNAYSKRFNS
jgi:alanine-glyoxylate transaminase/serine-glyoxylate transaminase/serine-pyruvate transaminase